MLLLWSSHKSSHGVKSYYCAGHSIIQAKAPANGLFSKISRIVWSFVLGHLFVKGENCLQSSSIHRVRHDVAKQREEPFLFCLYLPFEEMVTFPPPCLTHDVQPSSRSCFFAQHYTNVLLNNNTNSLNLEPSVPSRCFIPSPVLCLCPLAHLHFLLLVPDVAFSLQFTLEVRLSFHFITDVKSGVLQIPFNEAAN